MINVQAVSKRFDNVVALTSVSLRVERGERVALVGSNGSGKTTLMRAVCGLLRVEGKIEIDGIDVALNPARALAALAYMPQGAPPLEAPVAELVRAYCSLRGLSPPQVASQAARLTLDLDTVARTRVRDLSGGMKQKLLAALALTCEAPLLVCDEPSASLDAEARAALFEALRGRSSESTLVLCSHRLDEVRGLVSRVIEMKDGRVARDEPIGAKLVELRPAPSGLVADEVDAPQPIGALRRMR